MSKWLKALLFVVWGLLLLPLTGNAAEHWLEQNVLSGHSAMVANVTNDLAAARRLRWFDFALTFMSGIVVGMSLEALARRRVERKAFDIKSLGSKFGTLSESIKSRTSRSGWPDNARDLRPAIVSALLAAKKHDLWVPGERVFELPDGSFLCEYFSCVGRLLEAGHLGEASREALSWKPFLDREMIT